MKRYLVLIDADRDSGDDTEYDKVRRISTNPRANVSIRLKFTDIRPALAEHVSLLFTDLLYVATACYEADEEFKRGTDKQVLEQDWKRELVVLAAVGDPDRWNAAAESLSRYLNYLTGDSWCFGFVQGELRGIQRNLFDEANSRDTASLHAVSLLSGGLDSLVGAVDLCAQSRGVVLASHYSASSICRIQKELISGLKARFPESDLMHVCFRSTGYDSSAQEVTRRSRGFVYLSLGIAVAEGCGVNRVHIPENGIVSLNLPRTAQAIGTKNSRATHPRSIALFEEFIEALTDKEYVICNPLLYATRYETIKRLQDLKAEELIGLTSSCIKTRQMRRGARHCGVCSQCIDRRFALEFCDGIPVEDFRFDIFHDGLVEWGDRMQALSYVEWARMILDWDIRRFFCEYEGLHDALNVCDGDLEEEASRLYDLHQRHAEAVVSVMDGKIKAANLVTDAVPDNSLVRLVAGKCELSVRQEFIAMIDTTLRTSLRTVPSWPALKDETEVQGHIQTILTASGIALDREGPMVPFAGVSFKPDFSDTAKGKLFIEVKYPRKTRPVVKIVNEILAAQGKYTAVGANGCFVVVDPQNQIRNRDVFLRDLMLMPGMWIVLIP